MAVMTYDNLVHRGAEHMILAKIVTGIKTDAGEIKWLLYDTCLETTTADNIPGGLKSIAHTEDGMTVVTEIYPMIAGRDSMAWEGGAIVRIHCEGAHGLEVRFGCGDMSFMHFSPNEKIPVKRLTVKTVMQSWKTGMRSSHRKTGQSFCMPKALTG